MANRRMFAKSIVQSGKFLNMPPSTRLLYYDLGMNADDDGVSEAITVMRMSGATIDDLRVLSAKGYIKILNEDYVSYITDWKTNNLIMKDKYHEGIYKSLLVDMTAGTKAVPERYPNGTEAVPEVRLGQVRLGQDSSGQGSVTPPTAKAVSYILNIDDGWRFDTRIRNAVAQRLTDYLDTTYPLIRCHTLMEAVYTALSDGIDPDAICAEAQQATDFISFTSGLFGSRAGSA